MLNLQLLDTVSFIDKLSSNFACSYSKDNRISIITENGILIYTLTNFVNNSFSDIAFRKKFIKLPEASFSKNLHVNYDKFYTVIPRNDLYEKALSLDYIDVLENSAQTEVKPVSAKWSPVGLQGKSECLLGILTNFHELLIYKRYLDETGIEVYECVENIHRVIVETFSKDWKSIDSIKQSADWDKRVSITKPTAFEWSHLIDNKYAILFVSHPNKCISAWKFEQRINENKNNINLIGKYESFLSDINILYWQYGSIYENGALCYGNVEGRLSVISVKYSGDSVEFVDETQFYNSIDEKKVEFITIVEYNSYSFLLAVKEEFLIIFGVDKNGVVFDEITLDLGNLHITGLSHYRENIILASTIGAMRKITLNVSNERLSVLNETIPIKLDTAKLKIHGVIMSENRIFLGLLAYPIHFKNVTRDNSPSKFIIYYDSSISPFQKIIDNTTEPFWKYFDCFEVLRLLSYKNKKFPWEGIDDNLNYDNLTLTQLKSLRWIAKLSENVYSVVPSITSYKIKSYILLNYMVTMKLAVNRIEKLLKREKLTEFQMMSIDVQNMFLKEMVVTKILEKSRVGDNFLDALISVMEKANELEYPDMLPCFWCGEKIIGPSCIPPHAESRCSISMMPIFLIPGYKCLHCDYVAHTEISNETEIVTCEYCDFPMDKVHEKIQSLNEDIVNKSTSVELKTEELNDEDVDVENGVEYSALSDSEDEISQETSAYLRYKFLDNLSNTNNESKENHDVHLNIVDGVENSDYSLDDDDDVDNSDSE